MTRPGAMDRSAALLRLAAEPFDVVVVGGGITGAGVALDAASRGLRTALVEADDFAAGTSSKSSKLVHGGLRYLQQKEYRLVYENLAERQRLLDNAPHLVTPLPFLIPLFGKDGTISNAVAKAYRTALWLYDVTGGVRIGKRHSKVTREQALAHMPTLRTDRLVAGFLYWDARADDARLTLEIVRTAALDHGAVVANHCPVEGFLKDEAGRLTGVSVAPAEGRIDVRARAVVNAAGVWAEEVGRLDDDAAWRGRLRPAKGIHVTVPADVLPCDIAAVLPVPGDRRSVFVVPWEDHTYIGTTDTDYDGPLDHPTCDEADVTYVLDAVNAWVSRRVERSDVVGTWAGLRPLVAGDGVSARTADLSRRHSVSVAPSGLVSVTGGKLTTYRKMAEDTVDAVVGLLGDRRRPCRTKRLRLRGAGRVDASVPDHLRARHGDEADAVLALVSADPELGEPLVRGLPYLRAEAVHAVRHEMATTLDDVLSRRTRALLLDAAATLEAAADVAALVGDELGWDEARRAAEVASFRARVAADMAVAGVDGHQGGEP